MKFNFFEKAAVATAITAAVANPNLTAKGEAGQDLNKNGNEIETSASIQSDANADSETFVFNDKESNEGNEKMANLEMAKEAISHADGKAYISKNKKLGGYVFVTKQMSQKDLHTSGFGFVTTGYRASNELQNGYKVFTFGVDGQENSTKDILLANLNENGINSNLTSKEEFVETNGIGVSFVYDRLIDSGMNPVEIANLLKEANLDMTREILFASLGKNPNSSYSPTEIAKYIKDIELIKASTTDQNLAEKE